MRPKLIFFFLENRCACFLPYQCGKFCIYRNHILNVARKNTIKMITSSIYWLRSSLNHFPNDLHLMYEGSEEELKSLLMKMKEESKKAGLKLNTQKTKIKASGPITSWKIDGETMDRLHFLELQNHCRWWLQPWN